MNKTNILLFLLLSIFALLYSCVKEDTTEGITRNHYYGTYKGVDTNSLGETRQITFKIYSAPVGEEYVYLRGVARYNNQEWVGKINQEHLSIIEKTYHVDDTLSNGFHAVYDATYQGSATIDTLTYKINFNFTEKQVYADSTVIIKWISSGTKQ